MDSTRGPGQVTDSRDNVIAMPDLALRDARVEATHFAANTACFLDLDRTRRQAYSQIMEPLATAVLLHQAPPVRVRALDEQGSDATDSPGSTDSAGQRAARALAARPHLDLIDVTIEALALPAGALDDLIRSVAIEHPAFAETAEDLLNQIGVSETGEPDQVGEREDSSNAQVASMLRLSNREAALTLPRWALRRLANSRRQAVAERATHLRLVAEQDPEPLAESLA